MTYIQREMERFDKDMHIFMVDTFPEYMLDPKWVEKFKKKAIHPFLRSSLLGLVKEIEEKWVVEEKDLDNNPWTPSYLAGFNAARTAQLQKLAALREELSSKQ